MVIRQGLVVFIEDDVRKRRITLRDYQTASRIDDGRLLPPHEISYRIFANLASQFLASRGGGGPDL